MCAAFFINIYYAWKVKIVYDHTKICLLSRELEFIDFIRGAVIILINIGGFFILSIRLPHVLKAHNKVLQPAHFVRWTVCKSQFCGFAAQKVSTKLQLKNCRLARR
jgi:hypothetical protein